MTGIPTRVPFKNVYTAPKLLKRNIKNLLQIYFFKRNLQKYFPKIIKIIKKKRREKKRLERRFKRRLQRLRYIEKNAFFKDSTVAFFDRKFKITNRKGFFHLAKTQYALSFRIQNRKEYLKNFQRKKLENTVEIKQLKSKNEKKKILNRKEKNREFFKKLNKTKKKLIKNFFSPKKTLKSKLKIIAFSKLIKQINLLPRYIQKAIRKNKAKQNRLWKFGTYFTFLRFLKMKKTYRRVALKEHKYLLLHTSGLIFKKNLMFFFREKKADMHLIYYSLLNFVPKTRDPYIQRKNKEKTVKRTLANFSQKSIVSFGKAAFFRKKRKKRKNRRKNMYAYLIGTLK